MISPIPTDTLVISYNATYHFNRIPGIMFIILFRFDNLAATTSYIEYPFLGKYSIISDNIYNINVKHINTYPPGL